MALLVFALGPLLCLSCSAQQVQVLETRADGSVLLAHSTLAFSEGEQRGPKSVTLSLLPDRPLQRMDGFGAALTGSSAALLAKLPPAQRDSVMGEMFDPSGPLGITLLREAIGASDFSSHGNYSYDDVAANATDSNLANFSIAPDADLFPLLRQALSLNPALRFLILPWSAPAWMKSTHTMNGGSLQDRFVPVYASYLTRTVAAYAQQGLPVYGLSMQNEPLNENPSYPTELMSPEQEVALAAAVRSGLRRDGRRTLLLGYEHNWGNLDYPRQLLADARKQQPAGDAPLFDGISFHCYTGSESAQRTLLLEHPELSLWFTECSGTNNGSFAEDLLWQARHLLLGAPLNGARSVLLWNLLLDPSGGPHNGGCNGCRALFTVEMNHGAATLKRNPEYYLLAHAAPFVHPGAQQIEALQSGGSGGTPVTAAAYRNPDGTFVLIAMNSGPAAAPLTVLLGGKSAAYTMAPRSLVTLRWGSPLPVIGEGTYRLGVASGVAPESSPAAGTCLQASSGATTPTLQPCAATASQLWTVATLSGNRYEVKNLATAADLAASPSGALALFTVDGEHIAPAALRRDGDGVCFVVRAQDACQGAALATGQNPLRLRLLAPSAGAP